jgi:hypothetical protein
MEHKLSYMCYQGRHEGKDVVYACKGKKGRGYRETCECSCHASIIESEIEIIHGNSRKG